MCKDVMQANSKEKKKSDKKKWQRIWTAIFQKKKINGQQVHEEVLNIINHQGNINQNHNEILLYTCKKNGYYQKD